jgi:hypothetical protein
MLGTIRNELLKAVVDEFCWRFIPEGQILWVRERGRPGLADQDELHRLGISLARPSRLPTIVVNDQRHKRLVLIDVADLRGLLTEKRRDVLRAGFGRSGAGLILVNAFRNRKQLQDYLTEFPWGTAVWLAEEPDHLVYLNGSDRFGPSQSDVDNLH